MNLGNLNVILGAALTAFNRNMDEARGKIGKVADEMRKLVTRAATVAAASAAAGAAIMAGLVRAGMESVVTQQRMARALNASIDGMRALKESARDFGIEAAAMDQAMTGFNQKLGEAQRTGSPAAKMLEQLGLSARQLGQMDADKRLAAVSDRVRALGLSASQTADLANQLGLQGQGMAAMLMQGGDAIRNARKEIDALGLSISAVDAAQVEAAHKAMQDIGRTLSNIRDQIAIALSPYIQEIAERFNNVAAAAGGFREQARNGAEVAIRAFSKVADVIHGLRVVFKGVEVIAKAFGATVLSVAQMAGEGIAAFVDLALRGVNVIIRALNKVPGVEIAQVDYFTNSAFMNGLRNMAEAARNEVGDVRAELHALAMQELPSAKVEGFLDSVRDRANAAAEETVRARKELQNVAGMEGFGVSDDAANKAAEDARKKEEARLLAEQQARMDRIAALQEYLKTEEQLEVEAAMARMAVLEEMSEVELEQAGGYHALREQIEKDHMDRIAAIREAAMTDMERFNAMSWDRQVTTVAGQIANMTAGVASGNKKMFELNKAAALAQAAVGLPAAIIDSYKNAGGWPLGAAAAAAMAAAGAAQIAQIKNAKFGGGGGLAPSQAGTPATPVAQAGGGQTINISGVSAESLFTGSSVRGLLERLQDAINDGGTLVLD